MVTILKESLDEIVELPKEHKTLLFFGYYAGNHKTIDPELPE
jgi:hypothetical protein